MSKRNCTVEEHDDPVCYCGKPGQWRRNDDTMQSLYLCDDCYKQMHDTDEMCYQIVTRQWR